MKMMFCLNNKYKQFLFDTFQKLMLKRTMFSIAL